MLTLGKIYHLVRQWSLWFDFILLSHIYFSASFSSVVVSKEIIWEALLGSCQLSDKKWSYQKGTHVWTYGCLVRLIWTTFLSFLILLGVEPLLLIYYDVPFFVVLIRRNMLKNKKIIAISCKDKGSLKQKKVFYILGLGSPPNWTLLISHCWSW